MSEIVRGSCVCDLVRYALTPPYLTFQHCHCSRCRKATGSAHAANLFVRAAQLTWAQGQEHVRTFELPSARYWNHSFCDTCGSSLPWLTRTGKAWVVPAGTLDDDPEERPVRTIFWDSRAPWTTCSTELETFAEGVPRR